MGLTTTTVYTISSDVVASNGEGAVHRQHTSSMPRPKGAGATLRIALGSFSVQFSASGDQRYLCNSAGEAWYSAQRDYYARVVQWVRGGEATLITGSPSADEACSPCPGALEVQR